jgi:tRNA pseudouridine(38-40) synthase
VRRTYRYFEANHIQHPSRLTEAAALFTGEIDVRSFGRSIPAAEPHWRTIDSVTIRTVPGGAVVEVQAPAFVWGMVRKIVATLREVDAGRLSPSRLKSALEGRARLTLPMAEPEPLLLWEVEYPFPWTVFWRGPNRPQSGAATQHRAEMWTRGQVLDSLMTGVDDPRG